MDNLAQRINQHLAVAKTYTAFGAELGSILPDDRIRQAERVRAIQAFAEKNGWSATILDPGIHVTFKKIVMA